MTISYVSGQMLNQNLNRAGVDLSISNANVGINTLSPGATFEVAGNVKVGNVVISNVGNINAGNVVINNVGTPVANTDAATKGYVLNQLSGNVSIGNLTIVDTTISASTANANILVDPPGIGQFQIVGTNGFVIPVGNTLQRPSGPATGTLRFNNTTTQLEVYDGSDWVAATGESSVITNETFYGDGATVNFTLGQEATSNGIIVTLNGLQQSPGDAYTATGTTLTFSQAPAVGDVIQVRFIAVTTAVSSISNGSANAVVSVSQTTPTVLLTGNLIPTSNTAFNLGNTTNYWKDLYLSGNTIFLGPLQLKSINSTTFGVFQSDGTTQANIDVGSIDVTGITNGTTNISIPTTNGNANISVNSTANVLVVASTGAFVTGLASVTGNVQAGNLRTAGQISATGNIIAGNVSATNLTGTAISVSGNITGGNVSTTNYTGTTVSVTGNITSGNVSTTNYTGTTVSVTGNVTAGNIASSSYSASGNVTGSNIIATTDVYTPEIVKTGSNTVGNIGQITNYFNTVFAQATSALYADLAELYLADQNYAPGTVLSFGGTAEVTRSAQDQDTAVAGVVSTKPAYQMNSGLTGDHVVSLALVGRVPCLVQGPVRAGDLMVSTNNGQARSESQPRPGTIIGKAVQSFDGDVGVIEVLVGKH